MKPSKQSWLSLMLLVCLLGGALFWTNMADSEDVYSSIRKNLTDLVEIYKQVSRRYVDTVDPDEFINAGIHGMLNTLDPYTTYIEQEDQHQLQVLTSGKYDGVGLLLNFRNNVVTVAEPPFIGTPAERAGIREGDIIIKVDSLLSRDLGFDKTASMIRGVAGTEVSLTIEREGLGKPLIFKMKREHITVDDIRYSGIVGNGIGYILLTRFSKNAGQEVASAIQNLKTQNLQGLILDLRSNPGGMLEAAVEVSELFLPKGSAIVSTKGRVQGSVQEYKSPRDPIYGDGPLMILVNRISASASEIVAGAIQDQDRGIVIGDTTFGKGLVQSVVPLSPSSALKITTAKYYTPSGRCIQRQKYSFWNPETAQEPTTPFQTRNGRPVWGGGGIIPDIVLNPEYPGDYVLDLRRKSLFFNFAVHYANTHEAPADNVIIGPEILKDFKNYLSEKNYVYQHPAENTISSLKAEAVESGYGNDFIESIQQLQESFDITKRQFFDKNENIIRKLLRIEIASKYFGTRRSVELEIEEDPVVQKALEMVSSASQYQKVLQPSK